MFKIIMKLEPIEDIKTKINNTVRRKVDRNIRQVDLLKVYKDAFSRKLEESPTWKSLDGGKLAADFGFERGSERSRLDTIKNYWLDTIKIKKEIKELATLFKVTYYITGVPLAIADLKSLTLGTLDAMIVRNDDTILPWFEWLTLKGDATIIEGFDVKYGSFPSSRSRSGRAIMTRGGSFSVDPQYSGIEGDNFLTDVIIEMQKDQQLAQEIQKIIITALNKPSR